MGQGTVSAGLVENRSTRKRIKVFEQEITLLGMPDNFYPATLGENRNNNEGEVIMKTWKKVALGVGAVAVVAATGGAAAVAFAPAIASAAGAAGLLGAASSGTVISTLTGVALANASLAACGGGALVAGGGGMAAGTIAIGVGASAASAAVTGITAKVVISRGDKK